MFFYDTKMNDRTDLLSSLVNLIAVGWGLLDACDKQL